MIYQRIFDKAIIRSKQRHAFCCYLHDLSFNNCDVYDCSLFPTNWPRCRGTIRNIQVTDCRVIGHSRIDSALIEDVVVQGLGPDSGGLWIGGCAFKHVRLAGKIGPLIVRQLWDGLVGRRRSALHRSYQRANERYYSNVDWALDISDAQCCDLWISGVPARLVRRDRDTQIIVRRDRVLAVGLKNVAVNEHWQQLIQLFIDIGDGEIIFGASARTPRLADDLAQFEILRRAGVADCG